MKDYRLSEIKAICEKANYDCEHCEFVDYQWLGGFWGCLLQNNPRNWQIDLYKTAEQYRAEMIEQCGGCPAFSGDDCTRNPYTEGCLKEENEDDETRDNGHNKEQVHTDI